MRQEADEMHGYLYFRFRPEADPQENFNEGSHLGQGDIIGLLKMLFMQARGCPLSISQKQSFPTGILVKLKCRLLTAIPSEH